MDVSKICQLVIDRPVIEHVPRCRRRWGCRVANAGTDGPKWGKIDDNFDRLTSIQLWFKLNSSQTKIPIQVTTLLGEVEAKSQTQAHGPKLEELKAEVSAHGSAVKEAKAVRESWSELRLF